MITLVPINPRTAFRWILIVMGGRGRGGAAISGQNKLKNDQSVMGLGVFYLLKRDVLKVTSYNITS